MIIKHKKTGEVRTAIKYDGNAGDIIDFCDRYKNYVIDRMNNYIIFYDNMDHADLLAEPGIYLIKTERSGIIRCHDGYFQDCYEILEA